VEDMDGGTFTISNGGVFGSLMGTPIINPPQSAILGMHGIFERPVAVKGEVRQLFQLRNFCSGSRLGHHSQPAENWLSHYFHCSMQRYTRQSSCIICRCLGSRVIHML